METPDTVGDQCRLKRLVDPTANPSDWGKLMDIPETCGDQWRLQRLVETSRDPRDWGRPVETS